MPLSVLYIHHNGDFSGAQRSFLEMLNAFPINAVKPHVVIQKGKFAEFLKKEGVPVIETRGIAKFDNTQYGYYRGLRWVILAREIVSIPFTFIAMARARLKWKDIQIVHVNEVTALLPIILAKVLFKKPVVVHVRSVQQTKKAHLRIRLIKFVLTHFANKVIAIDETVKNSLPPGLDVQVVHNGFAIDSVKKYSGSIKDDLVKLPNRRLKVGMVGSLLQLKGVYDFIEAAKLCVDKNMDVDFIIVGDNPRNLGGISGALLKKLGFAHDVKSDVEQFIQTKGLVSHIHLIGFALNIEEIYKHIDVLCFPSHLNAVGRPVFEAAFLKVPSIVAITNPLADTMIDGKTGICIEPKNPAALAEAIEYFYSRPEEVTRMGEIAYELAWKYFDIKKNALEVLDMYGELKSGK